MHFFVLLDAARSFMMDGRILKHPTMQLWFFSSKFNRSQSEIRERIISAMPTSYFKNVPIATLADSFQFLLEQGFSAAEIYEHIWIIFYQR